MNINWFPGHMKKTLRQIDEAQKKIDVVLYVLDARAPFSCLNPAINKVIKNKPIVFVFTKTDMADASKTKKWQEYFEAEGRVSVGVDATKNSCKSIIISTINNTLKSKIEANKKKGISLTIRAMVVGVPNSGKSTLINTLSGGYKASTGNLAGITRSTKWIKMENGYEIMDTPGTLSPRLEDKKIAYNLAFLGSVKDEVTDTNELALKLISHLKEIAPEKLKERYNLDSLDEEPITIYEQIAKKRGFILKKNEPDYDRTGRTILDEFRKGRIGKITLDTFDMIKAG